MRNTDLADDTRTLGREFFDETPPSGSLSISEDRSVETRPADTTSALDVIFTIVKWLFLVLPGIAVIHLSMGGLALMLFYREFWGLGLLGLIAVGTFMIMLGLGKMRDLKYLKTVLTVLGFSCLVAILWDVLAIFIKGDFLGLYLKLTFPLVAIIGYLSKRKVDAENEE